MPCGAVWSGVLWRHLAGDETSDPSPVMFAVHSPHISPSLEKLNTMARISGEKYFTSSVNDLSYNLLYRLLDTTFIQVYNESNFCFTVCQSI